MEGLESEGFLKVLIRSTNNRPAINPLDLLAVVTII